MRISRKTDYAVRILIELARNSGKVVSARVLSDKLHVPYRFLTQVIRVLRLGGFVRSQQGFLGGYKLARPAGEISLLEVVERIHGPIELVPCLEKPPDCKLQDICGVQEVWKFLDKGIRDALGSVTLDNLTSKAAFRSFNSKRNGKESLSS